MVAPRYQEHVPAMCAAYAVGSSIYDIGRQLSVPPQTVRNKLLRAGVEIRSRSDRSAKYPVREGAFQNLSREHDAYWFGFLLADGALIKHTEGNGWSLAVELASRDRAHLGSLRDWLAPTAPVFERRSGKSVTFRIARQDLAKTLITIGMGTCKSKRVQFPAIPYGGMSHFLRGLFDGDGSVGFRQRPRYITKQGAVSFVTASSMFIEPYRDAMAAEFGVSRGSTYMHNGAHTVRWEGRDQVSAICRGFYDDAWAFLARKKQRFVEGLGL